MLTVMWHRESYSLTVFISALFLMAGGIPILRTSPGTSAEQYRKVANMIQRVDFEAELFFVDPCGVILPKPAVRRRAMLGLLNHRTESPRIYF